MKKVFAFMLSVMLVTAYAVIGASAANHLNPTFEDVNQFYGLAGDDKVIKKVSRNNNKYENISIYVPSYNSEIEVAVPKTIQEANGQIVPKMIKEYGCTDEDLKATPDRDYKQVILAHKNENGYVELYTVYMKCNYPDYHYLLLPYHNQIKKCPFELHKTGTYNNEIKTFGYNGSGESFEAIVYAEEYLDLGDMNVGIANGRLMIGNMLHSDTDAWNAINASLLTVVNGITAVCFMACTVILMIQIFRVALSAGNPNARSHALKGLLWTGIAIAGVSASYGIFMLCYNLF